ncbi:unnamed protein product [Ixodes pacificus]
MDFMCDGLIFYFRSANLATRELIKLREKSETNTHGNGRNPYVTVQSSHSHETLLNIRLRPQIVPGRDPKKTKKKTLQGDNAREFCALSLMLGERARRALFTCQVRHRMRHA